VPTCVHGMETKHDTAEATMEYEYRTVHTHTSRTTRETRQNDPTLCGILSFSPNKMTRPGFEHVAWSHRCGGKWKQNCWIILPTQLAYTLAHTLNNKTRNCKIMRPKHWANIGTETNVSGTAAFMFLFHRNFNDSDHTIPNQLFKPNLHIRRNGRHVTAPSNFSTSKT